MTTSFGGIYQLKKLRDQGLHTKLIDIAGDVGGTWYWYVVKAYHSEPLLMLTEMLQESLSRCYVRVSFPYNIYNQLGL
jgi:cation diffusion facilitator CzcD-associated flavoprotein CzcO